MGQEFILKTRTGDYVGEDDTFNTQRSYAKRFGTMEEAEAAAKEIRAELEVEPA